jgi:sporulation protein YlmC with PRC-barrel domain
METRELQVEQLLGKKVRDTDGRVVGRLEEFHVEVVDGEHVVTEFLIGPAAALALVGIFLTQLPFFGYVPMPKKEYCVSWTLMDLTNPDRPTVRARRNELRRADE